MQIIGKFCVGLMESFLPFVLAVCWCEDTIIALHRLLLKTNSLMVKQAETKNKEERSKENDIYHKIF